MRATRDGFGKKLAEIGADESIVVLDADLSKSTKSSLFAEKYPERFFDIGVAEQNMIGIAAGLSTCNKIPFACTFAVFATGRVYDQIRVAVAYSNLNVKIVGSHGGLMTGEDGASHQALEDISLMRSLPNMVVIQPMDANEAEKATEAIAKYVGPVYLRLGREKVPDISSNNKFEIGKGIVMKDGSDLAIFATGSMVTESIKASEELEKEGISTAVINIHTIKPIDENIILKYAGKVKAIITAEDHSIIGGLGSAVSEVLAEKNPVIMKRIGVNDVFGESGKPKDLYEKYGLTEKNIAKTARQLLGTNETTKEGFIAFSNEYFSKLGKVLSEVDKSELQKAMQIISDAQINRKQIFIIGNGGSASTASHFATDLSGTVKTKSGLVFRAIALTDNTSLVTKYGNDEGYERIFSEQIDTLCDEGDVLIAISGSGNSPNILRAVEFAKSKNLKTIGFAGFGGGKLKECCDVCISVEEKHYGRVEDLHLILEHLITDYFVNAINTFNTRGENDD